MKLVLISAILFLGFVAQAEDKSSGCGLGWQVAPRTSLISSYTRSFTNALTSATSGMTSGTSGCDKHSIVEKDKSEIHYAEVNFHSLMLEMAQGQGDYVSSLATVMGCADKDVSAFNKMAQKNYKQIFPQEGTTPDQLINTIKADMNRDGLCQISAI